MSEPIAVPEPLGVALRAYTEGPRASQKRGGRRPRSRAARWSEPRTLLAIDTETTTDQAQRLKFGAYRYARWIDRRLICVEETLFYADDLPERDPDGYKILRWYVRRHALSTAANPEIEDASPVLRLISESEFREVLRVAACDNGSLATAALIAGFNLGFDLSRIALDWGAARSKKYASGFSFQLWDYRNKDGNRQESPLRPRLGIKHLGSTKALKGFIAPFSGHFLDLRTLVFALTNQGHSLASACKAFGVTGAENLDDSKRTVEHGKITPEYIDYCREDVRASLELYERAITEYQRNPIELQSTQAYSPASIGKAYLKAMGIRPRSECQPDFPRDVLGKAMSAYHGGRSECRIRRTPVPVVYCDFLSMYPTVNTLMGLWRHVIARRVEPVAATEEVRALLRRITVKDCLDPATWRQFPALVQVRPRGDVLPVRAHYEKAGWNIGSNPLYSDEPLWYALPDVISAKLLTGRSPEIIQAIKLVPIGTQRGLRAVKLRGEVEVDPRTEDFFRAVIERRKALPANEEILSGALKVLASSASYGIYAEMRRRELPAKKSERVTVHGSDGAFEVDSSTPETPGPYCFPPMAACITAAARLMLALLEVLVTDAGGTWAFADTDSMATVATRHGGLVPCPGGPERDEQGRDCVRALSWDQVDQVVRRFQALSPYDRSIVSGSVLEIESENFSAVGERRQLYCFSISAKRYALYNVDDHGQPVLRRIVDDPDPADSETSDDEGPGILGDLRKHSEHGLGHLLNPTDPDDDSRDWIAQLWEHIIRTDGHGLASKEPKWLDRAAVTRSAVTTWQLGRRFQTYNDGREKADQIRPFNFMLIATVAPGGHPRGGNPNRVALIAPYERDPDRWEKLEWTNYYRPGSRYRGVTDPEDFHDPERLGSFYNPIADEKRVLLKTFRNVLTEYRLHPEAKSLGSDGKPCHKQTRGLLQRRPVKVATITYIGKESNQLEEIISGLVTDPRDVLNEYQQPGHDPLWELARAVIRGEPVKRVAAEAQVSTRTVKRARAGQLTGKTARARDARTTLTAWAIEHARAKLKPDGVTVYGITPETLLATYLDKQF